MLIKNLSIKQCAQFLTVSLSSFRKYYKEKDGLTLDVGAFSKALEFASGVKPRVIGKPEPSFFLAAVKDMKLSPSEVCRLVICLCTFFGTLCRNFQQAHVKTNVYKTWHTFNVLITQKQKKLMGF